MEHNSTDKEKADEMHLDKRIQSSQSTASLCFDKDITHTAASVKTLEENEGTEFDEGYALEKYEDYKYRWTKAHISDEDYCATQSAYENDPEAEGMTFREYVEEFGFADGSCYAGFEEFVQNEFPLYALAEDIEQAMYECGEYDYPESDQLSWIGSDAPVDAVLSSLENDPASLVEYFRKELAVISPEDKWAGKAKECINKIQTLCDVEELKTQPEQNGSDTKNHKDNHTPPKKSGGLDEH